MKTIFYIIALLALILFIQGCEISNPEEATLSVNPSDSVSFAQTGGSVVVTVSTNQDSWKAVSDKDWCRITDIIDSTFTILVSENTTALARENAKVTIIAGDATAVNIKVVQTFYYLSISPDIKSVEFPANINNESFAYSVTSNEQEWQACVFPEKDTVWCKVAQNKTNSLFQIKAISNPDINPRTTQVLVKGVNAKEISVTVRQKGVASNDNDDYDYGDDTPWD